MPQTDNNKLLNLVRKDIGGSYIHAVMALTIKDFSITKRYISVNYYVGHSARRMTDLRIKYNRVKSTYNLQIYNSQNPSHEKKKLPIIDLKNATAQQVRSSLLSTQ